MSENKNDDKFLIKIFDFVFQNFIYLVLIAVKFQESQRIFGAQQKAANLHLRSRYKLFHSLGTDDRD